MHDQAEQQQFTGKTDDFVVLPLLFFLESNSSQNLHECIRKKHTASSVTRSFEKLAGNNSILRTKLHAHYSLAESTNSAPQREIIYVLAVAFL